MTMTVEDREISDTEEVTEPMRSTVEFDDDMFDDEDYLQSPPPSPPPSPAHTRAAKSRTTRAAESSYAEHCTTQAYAYNSMLQVAREEHPRDFLHAQNHPRWEEYREGTKIEMQAHMTNGSFVVISKDELPEGANVINTGLVFATKVNNLNEETIKVRLCAKGYAQKFGVDYFETYAPTVDPQTIRSVLAWAIQNDYVIRQMDIIAAFLIPLLPKDQIVYTNPPVGYTKSSKGLGMCDYFPFLPDRPSDASDRHSGTRMQSPTTGTHNQNKTPNFHDEKAKEHRIFFMWLKAVYGLKNAMYLWDQLFGKTLKKLGYDQQLAVDSCFYIRRSEDGTIKSMIVFHVDDLLVISKCSQEAELVEAELHRVLPTKALGRPSKFLGIEFEYHPNGDVLLHQQSYMIGLLERFKHSNCSISHTPAIT
jgi:hypothetical protein